MPSAARAILPSVESDQIQLRVVGEELARAVGPGLLRPWEAVLEDLRNAISPASWRNYLKPLRPVRVDGGRLSIAGPPHAANWSAIRYGDLILAAARRRMPEVRAVEFLPERIDTHPATRITHRGERERYRGWGRGSRQTGSPSRRPGRDARSRTEPAPSGN